MKQVLTAGIIVAGLMACNDNGTTNSGDTTSDSAYNNPPATDTSSGTGSGESDTNVKAGAGQGTGSGAQASQDTGTRRP